MILGGFDRGIDLSPMIERVAQAKPREVIVIGQTAAAIRQGLKAHGFEAIVDGGATMPEIVATAAKQAQRGDVVILSPGCASFDMFASYKDRGERFRAAVAGLPGTHEKI